ncbi:MAG: hypothetical protein K0S65_6390 [Labilithrix sp.]|nr:hypothetical protein [Labilithrix sp.]
MGLPSAVRVVSGSILLVCALMLTTARVEAARVRATLLVSSSKEDRALTERVRGQTSDLDAQIIVRHTRSLPPTLEARMREADAIATASSAEAVIWFRVVDSEVIIYAVMPEQDRVLVRSVAGGAGKPSSSTLEAAALVVRNVIRALGEGATIGELRAPPKEDDAQATSLYACASPMCAAPESPIALVTPPPHRASPTFLATAGFQIVRARDAPSMMNALHLQLGARYLWFSAAAVLTLGALDVERVTERVDILVRRHSLGLAAGATWALGQDASVGLNLTAGALSFVRATRSLAPTVTPTETQNHVRAFVGPEARVAFTIASPLSLVVSAGLDLVVNTPQFEVLETRGSSAVYALAVAQPRIGIGLEWSSFNFR